jgi:hypothetical protein
MKTRALIAAVLLAVSCNSSTNVPVEELRAGFENPPQAARPQVWWHWMNGNITKDGIRKDLEWMKSIGIGGVHHFDAGTSSTPQVVEKRLVYMQDDWKDAFRYAIGLADSLGLPVTIASSPGWSHTGGPWVEPADAMKKLVWRTLDVDSETAGIVLPDPFTTTGVFQDKGLTDGPLMALKSYTGPECYGDIAVVAVKLPDGRKEMTDYSPVVSSSNGQPVLETLTDESAVSGFSLTPREGEDSAWMEYAFPEPYTVRSVTLFVSVYLIHDWTIPVEYQGSLFFFYQNIDRDVQGP